MVTSVFKSLTSGADRILTEAGDGLCSLALTIRKAVSGFFIRAAQALDGSNSSLINKGALENQISDLNEKLEAASSENTSLKQHLETAKSASVVAQEEMKKWEGTIELAEKQKEILQEQNETLRRELKELTQFGLLSQIAPSLFEWESLLKELEEMKKGKPLSLPVDDVSIDPSLLQKFLDDELISKPPVQVKPLSWAARAALLPVTPQEAPSVAAPVSIPSEPVQNPSDSSSSSSSLPLASAVIEEVKVESLSLKQRAEQLRDQLDEKQELKYSDLKRELKQLILMMALGRGEGFDPEATLNSLERRFHEFDGKAEEEKPSIAPDLKQEKPVEIKAEEPSLAPQVSQPSEVAKEGKVDQAAVNKAQAKKVDENVTDCSASLARLEVEAKQRQEFWAEQKPRAQEIGKQHILFNQRIVLTLMDLPESSNEIQEKLNVLAERTTSQLQELKKVGNFAETHSVRMDLAFDSLDKTLIINELDRFEKKLIELESEFTEIEGEIVQEVKAVQSKKPAATLGSKFLSTVTLGYWNTAAE